MWVQCEARTAHQDRTLRCQLKEGHTGSHRFTVSWPRTEGPHKIAVPRKISSSELRLIREEYLDRDDCI